MNPVTFLAKMRDAGAADSHKWLIVSFCTGDKSALSAEKVSSNPQEENA